MKKSNKATDSDNSKITSAEVKTEKKKRTQRTTREYLLSKDIGYEDFVLVDGVPANKPRVWATMNQLMSEGLILLTAPSEDEAKEGRIFYERLK